MMMMIMMMRVDFARVLFVFCLFVWFVLYRDVGTVGPVGTLKPDPVTMV
jgi:hypothetical protein